MKTTQKQRDAIRRHYWPWLLRFLADGRVEARQRVGSPWGRLYSADELRRHLESLNG